MLPVKSVGDHEAILVEVIQDPISVVRHRSCEDDHLIVKGHFLEELNCPRSYEVATLLIVVILVKMYQSLIKVKDESVAFVVLVFLRKGWEIRNRYLRAQIPQLRVDLRLLFIILVDFRILHEVAATQESRRFLLSQGSLVTVNLVLVAFETVFGLFGKRNGDIAVFGCSRRNGTILFLYLIGVDFLCVNHYLRRSLLERNQVLVHLCFVGRTICPFSEV